jgi:hypothetical protein
MSQPFNLPSDLPNDFFDWPEHKQEQWIIEHSRNTQPPEENRRPSQMQGSRLGNQRSHLPGSQHPQERIPSVYNTKLSDPIEQRQVEQVHVQAEQSRMRRESTYLHDLNTLAALGLTFSTVKFIGVPLLSFFDAVFSFWGLSATLTADGRNSAISIILSAAIGFIIFGLGVSTNIKVNGEVVLSRFLRVDTNEDGQVSTIERLVFFGKVFCIITIVLANVSTNYLGMDQTGAAKLFPFIPGWINCLFLAIVLMVSPHVLLPICDAILQAIAELIPDAMIDARSNQARTTYAVDFGKHLLGSITGNASTDAQKAVTRITPKGKNYKIQK